MTQTGLADTVALLPPLTISCADWDGEAQPLYQAPRYARGPGMSRWHRPRAGTIRREWTSISFWCGYGTRLEECITASTVPEQEPVCGTCEGRALGAGQDDTPPGLPRLAFEPRWLEPPKWCPSHLDSSLVEDLRRNVGLCLVCGAHVSLRAGGGPYSHRYGAARHWPGDKLFAPCPWHAWGLPSRRRSTGTVGCRCGWPDAPRPRFLTDDGEVW